MRGNPVAQSVGADDDGSIPAYAGEPPAHVLPLPPSGVYPRVCGGTD